MENIKIGEYIKTKRKELNLTQGELANKLDVSHQAVSRWEKGDNLPDVEKIAELAVLFDVTIDFIVKTGTNEVQELKQDNNLRFFTLINGILCTVSIILYYLLLVLTYRFWIPVLVQYILVIGLSFIYIIPFSKIKDKLREDFELVRYSLLITLGSIMLTISSLFIESFAFSSIVGTFLIGTIFTIVILFLINLGLIRFEEKSYGIKDPNEKSSFEKNFGKVMIFVSFLLLSSQLAGLVNVMNRAQDHFSSLFMPYLQLFAIAYVILIMIKICKSKQYIYIVFVILQMASIIYYIHYYDKTFYHITWQIRSELVHFTIIAFGIFLFSMISYACSIIYLYIKKAPRLRNYIKFSMPIMVVIIVYVIQIAGTFGYESSGSGLEMMTVQYYQSFLSIVPLVLFTTIVFHQFYLYFKNK